MAFRVLLDAQSEITESEVLQTLNNAAIGGTLTDASGDPFAGKHRN